MGTSIEVEDIAVDEDACTVRLRCEPAGYPQADAREWADLRERFMRAARDLSRRTGRMVEVYDSEGCVIEQVTA